MRRIAARGITDTSIQYSITACYLLRRSYNGAIRESNGECARDVPTSRRIASHMYTYHHTLHPARRGPSSPIVPSRSRIYLSAEGVSSERRRGRLHGRRRVLCRTDPTPRPVARPLYEPTKRSPVREGKASFSPRIVVTLVSALLSSFVLHYDLVSLSHVSATSACGRHPPSG